MPKNRAQALSRSRTSRAKVVKNNPRNPPRDPRTGKSRVVRKRKR